MWPFVAFVVLQLILVFFSKSSDSFIYKKKIKKIFMNNRNTFTLKIEWKCYCERWTPGGAAVYATPTPTQQQMAKISQHFWLLFML